MLQVNVSYIYPVITVKASVILYCKFKLRPLEIDEFEMRQHTDKIHFLSGISK